MKSAVSKRFLCTKASMGAIHLIFAISTGQSMRARRFCTSILTLKMRKWNCPLKCTFYYTFPYMLFSYFSLDIQFIQKKFKLSNKIFFLLIYKFMHMLNISKAHSLNFPDSHKYTLSADLGIMRNWDGLSCSKGRHTKIYEVHIFCQ